MKVIWPKREMCTSQIEQKKKRGHNIKSSAAKFDFESIDLLIEENLVDKFQSVKNK